MGAEDFDKMQAYKIANGQVNANPLVDKDGMINLAMDYESEQESEGIVQKCIGLAIIDFKELHWDHRTLIGKFLGHD